MGSLKMLELKPVRGFDQKTGLLSVWTSVHWCAGSGFSQQIARLWPWTLLTSVTPVTKTHIWGPRWRECWHGHESNTVGLSQPSATTTASVTVPSITPPSTFLQPNQCDIKRTPPSVLPTRLLFHILLDQKSAQNSIYCALKRFWIQIKNKYVLHSQCGYS